MLPLGLGSLCVSSLIGQFYSPLRIHVFFSLYKTIVGEESARSRGRPFKWKNTGAVVLPKPLSKYRRGSLSTQFSPRSIPDTCFLTKKARYGNTILPASSKTQCLHSISPRRWQIVCVVSSLRFPSLSPSLCLLIVWVSV